MTETIISLNTAAIRWADIIEYSTSGSYEVQPNS